MNPKTIGERIRMLRIKKNLSVAEMAIQLDITRAKIYSWESGKYEPGIRSVALLSLFFNVTTDYLILGK